MPREPFEISRVRVEPGTAQRVEIPVARLVTQTQLSLPVTVLHGKRDGPRLWLSAALHGDELNGTEIIRRVLKRIRPARLRGTVVAVPVVNVFGFLEQSRYLPDRRDLNRSFPGSARGSLAARLAHLFLTEIVGRCTHGIDLHTGSNNRINMPQTRADVDHPETRRCAEAFSAPLMIRAKTIPGSLREAARKRGIPIVVYEAGEPMRFDTRSISVGVSGVVRVMQELGMLRAPSRKAECRSITIRKTRWLRASRSGIVHLDVGLRDRVEADQVVAHMYDTFGDPISRLRSTLGGIVIGHTLNPLVNRGEAVIHVAEIGQAEPAPAPARKKPKRGARSRST